MEKYKFKVRKMIANTVEVKANNYNTAFKKVLELMLFENKETFENAESSVMNYDIILEKINCENDIKSIESIKQMLKKLEEKEAGFGEKFSMKVDKKEDNFDKIICQKCGNHIKLNENFMS